ncbi:uncharacterized protein LOC127745434 [Arachis duranensis]|uniref:Uncharacterized protein LOC127745434 n=1 Tax=Arachis duranensis TaxID=130453 RepID=A0A9C6WR55_ARADU|nr:uncharacterized protein LOC127745434 [Arachis duranensis]
MEVLVNQMLSAREKVEEQNEETLELVEDPLQKSRELLKRQEQLMEEQQQSWREQEILLQKMDEHLENIGKHSEPLSKENEDQLMDVKEKVEEQDKEATVSSELSMKNEVTKRLGGRLKKGDGRRQQNHPEGSSSLCQRLPQA